MKTMGMTRASLVTGNIVHGQTSVLHDKANSRH